MFTGHLWFGFRPRAVRRAGTQVSSGLGLARIPGVPLSRRVFRLKPALRLISLVLLVSLARAEVISSFRDGLDGDTNRWTFMVFGDSQGTSTSDQVNTNMLTELARVATNLAPAFVLVTGDLVHSGNSNAFRSWSNVMAPVYQAGIGVYPVLGNHDTNDVRGFTNVFGPTLPANGPDGERFRTYAILARNALVLGLDPHNATNNLRFNQPWINAVLATNTRPHVFAFSHSPAFRVGGQDCLENYPAHRNAFWHSLRDAGARLYFSGHGHFYDHMRVDDGDGRTDNDLHQMIAGTADGLLGQPGPYTTTNSPWTPTKVYHDWLNGFVLVEIQGWNVTSTRYYRTGANAYAPTNVFTYSARPPPLSIAPTATNAVVVSWPAPAGVWLLQAATNFAFTGSAWTEIAPPYQTNGTNLSFTEPSPAGNKFYRLHKP